MKAYTAEERAALIEWLTPQIHELETACDEIPFGLDEDDAMQLQVMRIALSALEAVPEYNTSDAEDVHLDVSKTAFDRCHPDYRWISYTAPPVPEDWKKRALDAEEALGLEKWAHSSTQKRENALQAQLAEMEKQEPIGRVERGEVSDNNEYPNARVVCLHEQADWDNFQDGTELFLRPAPAVSLAELVPERMDREYRNGWPLLHSDEAMGWNNCIDAILLNIKEAK